MSNPTIHYWSTDLLEFQNSPEASPCGNNDPEAAVSYRIQDVTCKTCQSMLLEVEPEGTLH